MPEHVVPRTLEQAAPTVRQKTTNVSNSLHDAAHAEAASYHLQKFALRLPRTAPDVLFEETDNGLALKAAPSPHYGTLVHELTHFSQAMTTVLGQSVVANWLAFLGHAYACFEDGAPVLLPISEAQRTKPAYVTLVKDWNAYMGEMEHLIGATLPPVGSTDVPAGTSAYDFFTYELVHPADGKKMQAIAMTLPADDGTLLGVPLLGDAFIEGQAQAAQWMSDGTELSVNERLASRATQTPEKGGKFGGYYTAVIRLVRHRLPDWDALRTTVLLCDLALCARKPAEAFVAAFRRLEKESPPSDWAAYRALRIAFDRCSYWVEARREIVARLSNWPVVEDAPQGTPAATIGLVLKAMRQTIQAREDAAACFLSEDYDARWFDFLTTNVGCPPIFTQDPHFAAAFGDEQFRRACFFVRGTHDLVRSILVDDLQAECPFLRSKICNWKKTSACREGRLLDPPVKDGKTCHIGFAAQGLGILNRPVQRVK